MTTTTKAIKLTKTQKEVLAKAAERSNGRVYVQAWSQRCRRSVKGGGRRQHDAMIKLVEMGLLSDLRQSHNSGYAPGGEWNNGNKIYSTEAVAFITEAGRKSLDA